MRNNNKNNNDNLVKKLPIIVFTPYYLAKNKIRQSELDECLQQNISCSAITKLILLIDDNHKPPFTHHKLEIINISGYPTYKYWVELSKSYEKPIISVLANSDIYFDETLLNLHLVLDKKKNFLALSRFDRKKNIVIPHPNPQWSQDAWAFTTTSEINPSLLKSIDIPLGVTRCDNKIAYLFAIYGWSIINPHKRIRCVHLHESQQRSINNKTDIRIMGSVAYVYPSLELTVSSKLEIDIWARNVDSIKSITLNNCIDTWSKEISNNTKIHDVDNILPHSLKFEKENIINSINPDVVITDISRNAPEEKKIEEFILEGDLVYKHLKRFYIYYLDYQLLCFDNLNLRTARILSISEPCIAKIIELNTDLLKVFVPSLIDTYPIIIKERPSSQEDCQFWQYPCTTEKQAFLNHTNITLGDNIDIKNRMVNTYIGLPWATYIDKRNYPDEVDSLLKPYMAGFKSLVQSNGYRLSVHTVCQQIHWKRFLYHFHDLGVTDLHLSHSEKMSNLQSDNYRFRVHGWPLIAVNIENKCRSSGITIGKHIDQKCYFASFIGAHMSHYRSDVRLKLLDAAKADGNDDIIFELGNEWHFDPIVYKEQVSSQKLSKDEIELHDMSTQRYNEVLSDSIFSLCPEGAGPNTLRIWESLAVGAIPVIISDGWAIPKKPTIKSDLRNCCIFVKYDDISDIFNKLRSFKRVTIKQMQRVCIEQYKEWKSIRCY